MTASPVEPSGASGVHAPMKRTIGADPSIGLRLLRGDDTLLLVPPPNAQAVPPPQVQ